jgi:exonuclease III
VPGAPRPIIPRILAAGYVDCFRSTHPRKPGWTYPADEPWLRLDYVFASPAMAARLRACDVVATTEARAASDHLPLRADFG